MRTLIRPWSGRDFDGRTSSTSLSRRNSSPGADRPRPAELVEAGADDAAGGLDLAIDQEPHRQAAVCQPLAASPRKIVSCAASSSRWKGCGSNSAANRLIFPFDHKPSGAEVWPTAKSSSTHHHKFEILAARGLGWTLALRHWKGMAVGVVGGDEGVDGSAQLAHRGEAGAVEGAAGEDREPDLDLVQPAAWVGVKWKWTFVWRASQRSRLGLWVLRLSRTTWISWSG